MTKKTASESTYYVQVVIVKEFAVVADDELQAERAAYQQAGKDQHNIVGMKCYGLADEYDGTGALGDDMIVNMAEVKTFDAIDREWCEG